MRIKTLLLTSLVLVLTGQQGVSQTSSATEKEAAEIRQEIDKMGDIRDHKSISAKCGNDLADYIKHIDQALAIAKRKADGENAAKLNEELKSVNAEMNKLEDRLKHNPEMFMDQDCAQTWINAAQKYARYVAEHYKDFVPKE